MSRRTSNRSPAEVLFTSPALHVFLVVSAVWLFGSISIVAYSVA